MSRKSVNIESTVSPITDTIKSFYANDTKIKNLKKVADEEKETIKNYFIENAIDKMEIEDIKCTVTSSERSTFNTDKCLAVLSNMLINGEIDKAKYDNVVKMKPYIDEDYLEKAIYNNEFDASKLSNCIETKIIHTLKVSKKKG